MRKLFAIVFSVAFLFVSSNTQIEAISTNPQEYYQNAVESIYTDAGVKKELEDGKLTLELLEQVSSWKVLINMALPITEDYSGIENREDYYCVMLLEGIQTPRIRRIYHNAEYIKLLLGGIKLEEIDYDRLMQKYQAIIDIYNESNELQLIWEPIILSEHTMQVNVESTNSIEMDCPAKQVGELVLLKEGTIYWESSSNDGSGRYGIATDGNQYISKDYIVTVNGVAYLDESRTDVIESYYKPYDELGEQELEIDYWVRRMLHICTKDTDLGWVYAEDVVRLDCK